jgi:surface polysaccharide O-acyltransferase-like enzyme
VAYQFFPNLMAKLSWSALSRGNLVVVSLAVSLIATIPMHLFGAPEWSDLGGPLHFPTARSLLYFAWFFLGVALGQANPERSLSRQNLSPWPLWLAIGAASFAAYAIFSSEKYVANTPAWAPKLILATAFSFCCTFTSLAALGLARSFFRTNWSPADHFSGNAYGVYIFHYGFVTWMQFYLLTKPLPAALKFLITLSVALTASWFLTALLRKTTARKVL